jgi:hypothetical protein
MPGKWFKCPDGQTIEITKCLENGGCRMGERCATRPFLRLAGFDRKWNGVSPSSAGNGPRMLYLKAISDYVIDPNDRVWAALGTSTHEKLAMHKYANNVLTETKLSDNEMKGIADVLEEDEEKTGYYILSDYKTWGSFKVAKAKGIISETVEETVMDEEGKPVILKTGPNKGKPKTRQQKIIKTDPTKIDLQSEELQLNRYRIFFESYRFPISRMQIQVVSRDGGTFVAQNRGIERNLYIIPIKRLLNADVLGFYRGLADEVTEAFKAGYIRKCDSWESWERRRCDGGFCEVVEQCKEMSAKAGEKWGII